MRFAATHSREDLMTAFRTRQETGHYNEEVTTSRLDYGRNVVTNKNRHAVLKRAYHSFVNVFTITLFCLAVFSEVIGGADFSHFFDNLQDHASFIVIVSLIIISGLMTFIQETRNGKAASHLASMVDTIMTVRREGIEIEIDSRELVVGDIIILDTGDIIPADARILSCNHLKVDESALTGESGSVSKIPDTAADDSGKFGDTNFVFMGTNVVSGSAEAVIFNVGDDTVFGQMAAEFSKKRPETNYGKGSKAVVAVLLKIMLVLVPIAFAITLLKGDVTNVEHIADSLLIAVSLAIGLMPEMLPTVVSANLAKGAVQMSKKRVIVKDMSSVQSLGAMTVLCSDKTGTLTQNRISVESYNDILGSKSEKVARYVYLNAKNLTAATNQIDWTVVDDAEEDTDVSYADDYQFVGDVPFDSHRKRTSVVLRKDGIDTMFLKGDIESVLSVCDRFENAAGEVSEMTEQAVNDFTGLAEWYSTHGLRVLGVAYGHMREGQAIDAEAEEESIFIGFVVFEDPLKKSAKNAIESIRAHGVSVKVLTGDNAFVTEHVCDQLDINTENMLVGSDIDEMSDERLRELVKVTDVYASLSPENKMRIVSAIHDNGETVGMLGDGINDVLAMRHADVSISVDTGFDIAKETANMILLEKDLGIVKDGMVEGRRVYANTIKYVKMTSTANFGYMFSLIIATLLFDFEPMSALQILVFNLIIDISCLAIPWDNVDDYYLMEPRTWDSKSLVRVFTRFGLFSTMTDILTFSLLALYILPEVVGVSSQSDPLYVAMFQTCWFVENFWMQVQIIHIIRTPKIPFLQSCASKVVMLSSLMALLVGTLLPYTPLGDFLGMAEYPWQFIVFLPLIDGLYFVCMMLMKRRFLRKYGELL